MKLKDIIDACGLEVVVLPDEDVEISAAYTSDLLSDVMGHCPDDSILITVQNHKNSVAVSTLVGAQAIAVVHNRIVPDDMKNIAAQEGVALLRSADDQFVLSCKIGKLLNDV
jgi:hypothetical protein